MYFLVAQLGLQDQETVEVVWEGRPGGASPGLGGQTNGCKQRCFTTAYVSAEALSLAFVKTASMPK